MDIGTKCLLSLAIVIILKWILEKIYQLIGIGSYYQCICNINIGFGVMLVLGYAQRILVFFVERDFNFRCYCFIIYPITCIFFTLFFLLDYGITYKREPNFNEVPIDVVMVFTHGLILVAYAIIYGSHELFGNILIYQMWFTVVCGAFSTVYVHFLIDLVCYKNGLAQEVMVNVVEKVVYVETKVDNDARIECKICLRDYSDSRMPRVLTECGHTICEHCADELLKNNFKRFLVCPFCQGITAVNGAAKLLTKNEDVLYIARMLKQ